MKNQCYHILFVLLFSGFNVFAQFDYPDVEDYGPARELTLGYPNTDEGTQWIPLGIDLWEGDDVNSIHYGKIPPNSESKPVVVFVHGYATNAHVWFEGDDNMYWDVYRDGYRSAFVSLTPNRHMWTNGKMLASMINKITAHYGVSQVVLVGWSKGGVDIDAALVHFGANSKVSQVFALNAPHYGTGIAELANNILLSLVNIIFMQDNDATLCLQRGYMNYFRSLTDTHVANTVSYTTLGAWGNGPANRLMIPQGYLYFAGGSKSSGGNDGVVPYASSRRPGGHELFGGQRKKYFLGIPYYTGPDETDLDHYELTRGGLVWPHIKASLTNSANNTSIVTASGYNPNTIVSSKMQIVTDANRKFFIGSNTERVTILLAQQMDQPDITISNKTGKIIKADQTFQRMNEHTTNVTYVLENEESGEYAIESDQEFVGVVTFDGGIEAILNTGLSNEKLVYQSGEKMNFAVELIAPNGSTTGDAVVTGTLTQTADLQLNRTNEAPHIINFHKEDQKFVASIDDHLSPGIYNITVTAKGDTFSRNIVASVGVIGNDQQPTAPAVSEISIESAYPNPFQGFLTIDLLLNNKNTELIIYNIFGQKLKTFDLSGEKGKVRVQWQPESTESKGLYILQLSDGKTKITQKVMMR